MLLKKPQKKKTKVRILIMTQMQQELNNIVENMDLYNTGGRLSSSLNQMGYFANTTTVPVKEHPYDITKCVWKEGLEIHKTQVHYITPVLDMLHIKYNIMIVKRKTFPIIVFENGFHDFKLILKNIHLIPVIGGL